MVSILHVDKDARIDKLRLMNTCCFTGRIRAIVSSATMLGTKLCWHRTHLGH
jgi:hypothetical protein